MKRGLIPFQKKNGNDFIFRFQFGVEVRIHFHGIGRTVRRSTDSVLKDFQELFEVVQFTQSDISILELKIIFILEIVFNDCITNEIINQ